MNLLLFVFTWNQSFFFLFFLHINNCCVQIGVGKCFYPRKYYVNIGGKTQFLSTATSTKNIFISWHKKINDSGVFFSNAAQVSIAYLKKIIKNRHQFEWFHTYLSIIPPFLQRNRFGTHWGKTITIFPKTLISFYYY